MKENRPVLEAAADICPRASEWAREAFAGDAAYLLNEAATAARSQVTTALALVGISPRQMSIMRLLSLRSPIRQHDLGVLLGIDRTSMVGLIDGLEALGYVVREVAPNDRRAHALRLTETGVAANVDVTAVIAAAQDSLLQPLALEERELLVSLLGRLTSRSES